MSDRTSIEQIDAWRHAASESQHLELKEARTQFEVSRLREYCVAAEALPVQIEGWAVALEGRLGGCRACHSLVEPPATASRERNLLPSA